MRDETKEILARNTEVIQLMDDIKKKARWRLFKLWLCQRWESLKWWKKAKKTCGRSSGERC